MRSIVNLVMASIVTIGVASACHTSGAGTEPEASTRGVSGEQSLRLLQEGNSRFAENRARHPHSDAERRRSVAAGQHPFAIVLGCADSRVPVERVFDRGLGDLFVVRNAGNIVETDVLASIDYATTHLHVPLVVVLGHEKCGAVAAALGPKEQRAGEGADLRAMLDLIDEALEAYHVHGEGQNALGAGVEANVRWSVTRLRDAANGALPGAREVMFVGAVYDLESGRVRFLDAD